MIGAIIGDIVGSRFEFNNSRSRNYSLFSEGCEFTDDTVCTIATMDWLNQGGHPDDYAKILAKWVLRYKDSGFSPSILEWASSDDLKPYGSYGNGSAMRVSPVAWLSTTEGQVDSLADACSRVTHNSTEGIKGAQAIADCILMARLGFLKSEIREFIEKKFRYDLGKRLVEYRQTVFDTRCSVTVPAAIACFLYANTFESAIRNAIMLGGDSDTIADMAGAIADAYFGVPEDIEKAAKSYLPKEFVAVIDKFEKISKEVWERYVSVYKNIPLLIKKRNSRKYN